MKLNDDQKNTAVELALKGSRLKEIRDAIGVSVGQFQSVLESDISFAARFARARATGHDEKAETLLTIPDEEPDVQKARLKSDNVKWFLAKLKPETYGDRIDLNVNQTVDIGGALADARARLLPTQQTEQIKDVQPLVDSSINQETTTGLESVPLPKSIDDLID